MELIATRSKVSHHTRGGAHLLVFVGATSRYPHRVLFAPDTRNAYDMELSATQSKVSHHARGRGTFWYPWGLPLGIHYRVRGFPALLIQHLNITIIIIRTWDIWSLLRSDTGSHISDPNEFY